MLKVIPGVDMIVRGKSFFTVLFFILITSFFATSTCAQVQQISPLAQALSSRHPDFDIPSLLSISGSEDSLISELLVLRLKDKPGNLAINSEKILLEYTHRKDVRAALLEDVRAEDRFGLASVILGRIDNISDDSFRHLLAKQAFDSVKSFDDDRSKRFRLLLRSSSDARIKSMVQ